MAITGKKTEEKPMKDDNVKPAMAKLPPPVARQVENIFRTIDRELEFGINANTGAVSVTWLNEYIAERLERGFSLEMVTVVDSSPEGYTMAYVLVK